MSLLEGIIALTPTAPAVAVGLVLAGGALAIWDLLDNSLMIDDTADKAFEKFKGDPNADSAGSYLRNGCDYDGTP